MSFDNASIFFEILVSRARSSAIQYFLGIKLSVELEKGPGQSRLVSPGPSFPRYKAPPLRRNRQFWNGATESAEKETWRARETQELRLFRHVTWQNPLHGTQYKVTESLVGSGYAYGVFHSI